MTPRPIRPGETPKALSVWAWGGGLPFVALGLRKSKSRSWGDQYALLGVNLATGKIDDSMLWTAPSVGGMGPVLNGWHCWDEGPK